MHYPSRSGPCHRFEIGREEDFALLTKRVESYAGGEGKTHVEIEITDQGYGPIDNSPRYPCGNQPGR